MKGLSGQSVNELISLAVLALMVIALIGAQAGATAAATASTATPASTTVAAEAERPVGPKHLRLAVTIDDVRIGVDFESLAIRFAIGDVADGARGNFEAAVGRGD